MATLKKIKLSHASDSDYGIKIFMNNMQGISGILKHHYNDFMVNEVDQDDNVVILKNKSYSPIQKKDNDLSIDDALKKIMQFIPDQSMQSIKDLVNNDSEQSVSSIPISDKSQRTDIHKVTKQFFNNINTITNQDGSITFQKGNDNSSRVNWKEMGGEYLQFTMMKENKDTLEALDILSTYLRRPSKTFTFAGTKDKRAVTTQLVTAHKVLAESLEKLNSRLIGIQLGDFKYRSSRIELGDLNGNRFSIAIRNVQPAKPDLINESLKSLRTNGFINYFGMQRFGTHSIPTFSAGICLLKENWEEAINLILQPKDEDNDKISEARKIWMESKDAKKALGLFPRRCVAERSILSFFAKTNRNNDLLGAIKSIPRNLRLLYVHSYQSFVFNEMATERIKLYGNQLQIGDLVDTSPYQKMDNNLSDDPKAKNGHITVISNEADLANYTIDDLVLPLPGYDVKYPENGMMEAYKTFMGSHGFDPNDMRRKQKDFSLPGSYRKVLVKPKDFEWSLVSYDDPNSTIDLSISKENLKQDLEENSSLAVILKFTLPTSSYATMCLREFLKSETSSVYHHQLSVQSVES